MTKNKFIYYLGVGIILNAVLAGICAFFVNIPPENMQMVSTYYSFSFATAGAALLRYAFGNTNSKT